MFNHTLKSIPKAPMKVPMLNQLAFGFLGVKVQVKPLKRRSTRTRRTVKEHIPPTRDGSYNLINCGLGSKVIASGNIPKLLC